MSQQTPQQQRWSGKHLMVGLLLASLCLLGTGCDMKLPPMPWDPKPKPTAAAEGGEGEGGDANAEEGGDGEEGGEKKAKGPVKVDELDFLPPAMKTLPYEEMNIRMNDGLMLYGRLYDPGMKPKKPVAEGDEEAAAEEEASADEGGDGEAPVKKAYKGPKYPLIILLHGINRDHTTWSDLPASLVKAGYSVFALDLRGHGKSTHTARKNRVTWRLFEQEQWQLLPKDVDEVIKNFQKDEKHPQIDGRNVGLVGEKLGANVAVFTGRDMNEAVKAIVLISPGLDYKGIIPSQAVIDYTNAALLITTQDDSYSYKSTERLYNWLLGVKAMQVYKKIGDGSDMLSHQSALGDNITEWLNRQIPTTALPKTEAHSPEAAKLAKEETASETPLAKSESKSAKEKNEKTEKVEKTAAETPTAKPTKSTERKQPDTAHKQLPQERLGQADEHAGKPIASKTGKNTKPAAKPSKKASPKATSKSAPTPPTPAETHESPSAGQPPIPGG
jgi:pimeloyl-ACP methyl ester carboxylesterase